VNWKSSEVHWRALHCRFILTVLDYEAHVPTNCMSYLGLLRWHLSGFLLCWCVGNPMASFEQFGTGSLPHCFL
jgi:hypothetical protein